MQRPNNLNLTLRSLALLLSLPLSSVLLGQDAGNATIQNWSAPPYWQPKAAASHSVGLAKKSEAVADVGEAPVPFVAISPCRLADTRSDNGFPDPYGPPSMSPNVTRDFPVTGHCGVPSDAVAVSFNFTMVRTQGLGYLATYPQGEVWGGTSTVNYVAGQIVANSTVVALGATGELETFVAGTSGRSHHRHQRLLRRRARHVPERAGRRHHRGSGRQRHDHSDGQHSDGERFGRRRTAGSAGRPRAAGYGGSAGRGRRDGRAGSPGSDRSPGPTARPARSVPRVCRARR